MNIEPIKNKLLVKYPLFGSVVANSSFIEEPSVGTAATDGKSIYYNPEFVDAITDDEKIFVFAHEICHIAFNHIFRSEGKDKVLWNIATDSVVNALLKKDGLPLVEGGIDIPEAINYDAEEMYRRLLEEKKQDNSQEQNNGNNRQNENDKQSNQSNKGNFGGTSLENQDKQSNMQNDVLPRGNSQKNKEENEEDVGHDTHSMWDKAIENEYQKEKNFNKRLNNKQENKEEIKKLTKLGEKESFKQNKITRKKQLEELRKALASTSHGHGNTTNSEIINIANIGVSKPLIDWRRLLKEAVKYDIDWSYQNAEVEDGVVTAHLEEFLRPETEIVLDTSGSIDEILLRNFLRECKNILQTSKVKVGCFDTKFYGFTEIKNVSDIDNLSFYGSGGTDFSVAINAFTRRVENKIIFTDGDADMPEVPLDAIWIVFGGIPINPLGGKVIYIDEEQLEELSDYQLIKETRGKSK